MAGGGSSELQKLRLDVDRLYLALSALQGRNGDLHGSAGEAMMDIDRGLANVQKQLVLVAGQQEDLAARLASLEEWAKKLEAGLAKRAASAKRVSSAKAKGAATGLTGG